MNQRSIVFSGAIKVAIAMIATFTFGGYYVVLILALQLGYSGETRLFTIPLRIIVLALMVYTVLEYRHRIVLWEFKNIIPGIFIGMYLGQVARHYICGLGGDYSRNVNEILQYMIVSTVCAYYFYSQRPIEKHLELVKRAIIISIAIFVILGAFIYRDYIGEVSRISLAKYSGAVYETISPLALSYCSGSLIGIGICYLTIMELSARRLMFYSSLIIISIPAFLLGASRGSVAALICSVLFANIVAGINRRLVKSTVLIGILLVMMIYITMLTGSGLIERIFSTKEKIGAITAQASRLELWHETITQIWEYPFFGNRLELKVSSAYPHNIYLEAIMATGMLGGIPFLAIFIMSMRKCIKLVRADRDYLWIVVLFIQSAIQGCFSGAVYSSEWFWSSMGLVQCITLFDTNGVYKLEGLSYPPYQQPKFRGTN